VTVFDAFVRERVGEERWEELCSTMERVAVMFHKGMVGPDFVDEHVTKPIEYLLAQMTNEDLDTFTSLLIRDEYVKGIFMDGITTINKQRGRKTP